MHRHLYEFLFCLHCILCSFTNKFWSENTTGAYFDSRYVYLLLFVLYTDVNNDEYIVKFSCFNNKKHLHSNVYEMQKKN